ncbi:STAS domain-containing protein [Nocardioides sp.]|nr:STAS domain-containing protein [Nocardioides sp.]
MDRRSRRGDAARKPCVEISHDGPVLVLGGDLDVRSTGEVRTALYDHLSVHDEALDGQVVVDISSVLSADPTALKVLAAASRQAQRYGVRVVLRGASPAVRRMLHLTRLIRVIELEREPIPA